MRFSNMISCVDLHTAGEPVRVVTAGFPPIKGVTMLEKRSYVLKNLDHLRRMIMREPRGHDAMYGAILTPAVTEDGDVGVLFIDNGGMGTMCGHGTMGVTKALFETGAFTLREGENCLRIDTPAGRVTARVIGQGGRVTGISFLNVPSFLCQKDVVIPLANGREAVADIAFGGAFYALVDAESAGVEITPNRALAAAACATEIRRWLAENVQVLHPVEKSIDWVYGTIFVSKPQVQGERVVSRNICIFGDEEIDRSPCGTGTSARVAQLFARGILKEGMTLEHHSVIDTVFDGTVSSRTTVGGQEAIIPRIEGMAYIMGFNQLVLEAEDPMPEGFRMGF